MTDYRAAASKAREQLDLDLGKLRSLRFDDIDVSVVRKRGPSASAGFAGGFLLGGLVGALIALVLAPQKGRDTRQLLARAGGRLAGMATGFVKQTRASEDDFRSRVAGDPGEGSAIEREIGDGAESVMSTIDTTGGTSRL